MVLLIVVPLIRSVGPSQSQVGSQEISHWATKQVIAVFTMFELIDWFRHGVCLPRMASACTPSLILWFQISHKI